MTTIKLEVTLELDTEDGESDTLTLDVEADYSYDIMDALRYKDDPRIGYDEIRQIEYAADTAYAQECGFKNVEELNAAASARESSWLNSHTPR